MPTYWYQHSQYIATDTMWPRYGHAIQKGVHLCYWFCLCSLLDCVWLVSSTPHGDSIIQFRVAPTTKIYQYGKRSCMHN